MEYEKIVQDLYRLDDIAYEYNINGKICDMNVEDFENLMCKAAFAIRNLRDNLDAALLDLTKYSVCDTCKNYNAYRKQSKCTVKKMWSGNANCSGCSKWEWKSATFKKLESGHFHC